MTGKLKIKEIAAQTGTSISTVSRVLAGKSKTYAPLKRAILECAQAQGVLEGMSQGPFLFNHVVIFAPSRAFDVRTDLFYQHVIWGIRDALSHTNVRLSHCAIEENQSDSALFLKKINEISCETALLIGIDDPAIHEMAANAGKPCVLINAKNRQMRLDAVLPDHALIGEFSTRYLIEQGHQRILVLICLRRETMEERLRGIRIALENSQLPFDEARQLIVTSGFGVEEAHAALDVYLDECPENERPTAILTTGDFMAAGAFEALSQHGLCVPTDMSILSMDSFNLAEIGHIPLTAVRIPRHELGVTALRLLQHRLALPNAPFSTVLQGGELTVGASVKRVSKRKNSAHLAKKTFTLY